MSSSRPLASASPWAWLRQTLACGLALGWLGWATATRAQDTWLVVPVGVGALDSAADGIADDVERALRARGRAVIGGADAVRRFEAQHSRAPYRAQAGALEQVDAWLRALSDQLASEDLPAARATLAELATKPADLLDLANRDVQRARRRFHACLLAAYLFDAKGERQLSEQQLAGCARDFPGMPLEIGGGGSEAMRAYLQRARDALAQTPSSELRVDVVRGAERLRCFARVDGIDRGAVPVVIAQIHAARVRVQVECGRGSARIHDVALRGRQTQLTVDPRLDASLQQAGRLSLLYPALADADASRVRHAAMLARAVGATQVLEVLRGTLRRIDVVTEKERVSEAVARGPAARAAVDFVLARSGEPARRRPAAPQSRPAAAAARTPSVPAAPATRPARPAMGPAARPFRTLAWMSAGLTTAAAVTAVVAWRVREGHVAKFNRRALCTDAEPSELAASCRSELNSADTAKTVLTAAAITAGVGLALTSVLLVLDAQRAHERVSPLACGAGPGEVGLACGLRF